MTTMIVFIPAIIATYVAFTYSPTKAFIGVYLPVLFCLPEYYRWIAIGLPDPTFSEATIIPIVAAYLIRDTTKWTMTFTDFLVVGFAFCTSYAEFLNAGFADAQNLSFDMLGRVVFPYMLAKGLIEPQGVRIAFAKQIVLLLFLVSIISVYEFKMGTTPWRQILEPFFPGQGGSWVTNFRWGFARIAGPYAHAILAGLILIIGYRLHRWLQWSNQWEPHFKNFSWLWFSKARILMMGLVLGSFMTISRGPWLAAVLAAGIVMIGAAKNRWLTLFLAFTGLVVVGVPVSMGFLEYIKGGRDGATSATQETAAYRKEMMEQYSDIAVERFYFGWGTNGWPKVSGMPSIDNHYLLMALRYGFTTVGIFVLIMITMSIRLFFFGMAQPPSQPPGSSLAFTLLSFYAVVGISIATVFLGVQTVPLYFLITGWAEGFLLKGQDGLEGAPVAAPLPQTPFKFQRVLT